MNKEEMRFKAAAMAMQGLCSNASPGIPVSQYAESAVSFADALLSALYPTGKESLPVPDADGWIEHRPGDAMPCKKHQVVDFVRRDGETFEVFAAGNLDWNVMFPDKEHEIIAWRPSKP
jgi:hypothetical protein